MRKNKITENTIWVGMYKSCKLKELDDSHLANTIQFIEKRCKDVQVYPKELLEVLYKLAKKRGLKKDFLERAQIPYINPEGEWEIWDFEIGKPRVISTKLANYANKS